MHCPVVMWNLEKRNKCGYNSRLFTADYLQWVGEIFFPWPSGNKPCYQICLYYKIELADDKCIPLEGEFWGTEQLEDGSFKLEFSWVDINNISDIELYPVDAKRLIAEGFQGLKHFLYKEK
jgi:hypothetical protein